MADLGTGINVNNTKQVCNYEVLEDLKNKAVDINLIANTMYDLDGTIAKFIAPLNIVPTSGDKTAVVDTCGHEIVCSSLEDFEIKATQWQNTFHAFAKCSINMLSEQALASALASYVKGWTNNEVNYFYDVLEAAYPAYAGDVTGKNVFEITEDMIVQLEQNGYDRGDMIVSYSSAYASAFRQNYQGCCELKGEEVSIETGANPFGVLRVVNGKHHQDADIIVYVKPYARFMNYCRMLPEIWDGVDKYKGRSLIGGEEGFGAGVYDPDTSGIQYTEVVAP